MFSTGRLARGPGVKGSRRISDRWMSERGNSVTHLLKLRMFLVLVLATAVSGGCSKMSATVTGTVKLDGQPLRIGKSERGTGLFRPVKGGATATALIDENGNYTISTGGTAALVPGDYLVSVRATEIIPASDDSRPPTGRPITPYIYGNPLESGLLCIVKRGHQRYDIELRSDAGPAVFEPQPEELPTSGGEVSDGHGDATSESDVPLIEDAPLIEEVPSIEEVDSEPGT